MLHIPKVPPEVQNYKLTKSNGGARRRSARRHFDDDGTCLAALRATTAARLVIAGTVSSLAEAATCCGSNRVYVAAAITLLKAEDDHALDLVLRGVWPLLETAARLKPRAGLVALSAKLRLPIAPRSAVRLGRT